MFLSLENLVVYKWVTNFLLINTLLLFSANLSSSVKIHHCDMYILFFLLLGLTVCELVVTSFSLNKSSLVSLLNIIQSHVSSQW